MGLLSDTLEDNRELAGKIELVAYVPIELPPALPPEVGCPVCDRVFGSDLALNNHIAREHGQEHVYIKANGRVIRSTDVIGERVRQCDLILLGLDRVELTIQTRTRRKRCVIDANTNLLEHIPADYVGEVHVTVTHGRAKQDFVIYFNAEPPFSTRELNQLVATLQERLDQGIEPDWSNYQQRQRSLARNRLEKQYLDAFFEYSLGYYLENQQRWREGGSHLETAMYLLRPYRTVLARTARRVLAIRMNCFTPLEHCQQSSRFYHARTFFVNGEFTLPDKLGDTPVAPDQEGLHNGSVETLATRDERVYIDGFTELVLEAVKAFYARDFVKLAATLETMERHPLATDANNEDKLFLLTARGARVQGNRKTARKNYERLQYHFIFGHEAQEFCNAR